MCVFAACVTSSRPGKARSTDLPGPGLARKNNDPSCGCYLSKPLLGCWSSCWTLWFISMLRIVWRTPKAQWDEASYLQHSCIALSSFQLFPHLPAVENNVVSLSHWLLCNHESPAACQWRERLKKTYASGPLVTTGGWLPGYQTNEALHSGARGQLCSRNKL